MRKLLLPIGLICFGILASLPFRRSQQDNARVVGQVSARALPASVAPLSVSGDPLLSTQFLLDDLQPVIAAKPTTSPPAVDEFPTSYEQVAVPLSGRDEASNLLSQTKATPVSAGQRSTGQRGSRWSFDRFGIPRPTEELQRRADISTEFSQLYRSREDRDFDSSPGLGAASGFGDEQPIRETTKRTLVRASEQKAAPDSSPPTQPASVKLVPEAVQSVESEPAERVRHWIREP